MAQVVEEMPSAATGGNHAKYPWAEWLDGRVWKLAQSVTLDAVVDEASGVEVVPQQVVEGDFSVSIEKMRTYARNAMNRRPENRDVRTRSDTELIEVTRVAGEEPVKVEQKVLYLQTVESMKPKKSKSNPAAAGALTAERLAAAEAGEQLRLDVDEVASELTEPPSAEELARVQAELDALDGVVTQADVPVPEPEGDPEWVEIPVEDDPQDPYAPPVPGEYPEMDRPSAEAEPESEAPGTSTVNENPGTSFVPGAAPAGLEG